jgi:hypothetical protein
LLSTCCSLLTAYKLSLPGLALTHIVLSRS